MKKIENLGVIKTKHSSGIAETDKGNKFPDSKCAIGDVMLQIEGKRVIVSKETYNKEYKADVSKYEKSKKEAFEKAKLKKSEDEEKRAQNCKALEFENEKLKLQLKAAQAEIANLRAILGEPDKNAKDLVDKLDELDDNGGKSNA